MNIHGYYPNRTTRQVITPGDTAWHLVGKTGTLYATYAALQAAGDIPWPGRPDEFPTGIPFMDVRSKATGGITDGSPMFAYTNSTTTPPNEDDMVSGSGQHMVYENDGIKMVWIKMSVATDLCIIFGMF